MLVKFVNKWAFKIQSKKLHKLEKEPKEFVELIMHQMIVANDNIPDSIKSESDKWLKERGSQFNSFIKLARKMRLVAKENPIAEDNEDMPHSRHWATFPSGLKICFTLRDSVEGSMWHLSVSKIGGIITQDEIKSLVVAFFDHEKPIKKLRGTYDSNIVHFFQPID
ncbi:hypothetical protein Psch_03537 [Pelotomaculum schinkii]|uniref:Uncharacterized protein n=2 Tax=Pelotomaculum schinkii TaxID=78350 RepID=A0A4Y7R768_9FIRM|nr:hypothetical protein Psch_03537 [Pelotomaculum schinkii]